MTAYKMLSKLIESRNNLVELLKCDQCSNDLTNEDETIIIIDAGNDNRIYYFCCEKCKERSGK